MPISKSCAKKIASSLCRSQLHGCCHCLWCPALSKVGNVQCIISSNQHWTYSQIIAPNNDSYYWGSPTPSIIINKQARRELLFPSRKLSCVWKNIPFYPPHPLLKYIFSLYFCTICDLMQVPLWCSVSNLPLLQPMHSQLYFSKVKGAKLETVFLLTAWHCLVQGHWLNNISVFFLLYFTLARQPISSFLICLSR